MLRRCRVIVIVTGRREHSMLMCIIHTLSHREVVAHAHAHGNADDVHAMHDDSRMQRQWRGDAFEAVSADATSCAAGFGLPNRRRRVFMVASFHGDARDVMLSQVS